MSLIPLGFWAASGGGAVGGSAYDLLASEILTSSQASVTFSSLGSLAADYQHLQIRMVTKDNLAGTNAMNTYLQFNGDTSTNYSWHRISGNGSAVSSPSGTNSSESRVGLTAGASSTANAFAATVVDILDPFKTTKYTTSRGFTGLTSGNFVALYSSNWRNTAAIDSILIDNEGAGSFITGSRFSLYGIKAA